MTDLTPDHPAVKAMIAPRMDVGCASDKAADRLNAALPHLTTATPENLARLRDTPVGRALKAEGWRESLDAGKNGSFSYQDGPIPPGTMTSRELADTEDD